MNRSVLIVGFGNPLAGDDGAGIAVVEHLRTTDLPPGVRVEVGGTDSLRLPDIRDAEDEIWLVDAVSRGDAPGTIHLLEHKEILAAPQAHATAHHLSVAENLRWMRLACPEMLQVRFRLWGIEPADLRPIDRLTPPVASAVARLSDRIRNEAFARDRWPCPSR